MQGKDNWEKLKRAGQVVAMASFFTIVARVGGFLASAALTVLTFEGDSGPDPKMNKDIPESLKRDLAGLLKPEATNTPNDKDITPLKNYEPHILLFKL